MFYCFVENGKADLQYEKHGIVALTFLDKPLDFILYLIGLFFALLLQAVASQIQNGSPWDR